MANPTTEQHGLTEHSHGAVSKGDPVIPQSSRGDRFTSYDVDAFEVPGGREEDWRFTPLKRLNGLHNGAAVAAGSAVVEVREAPQARF